MNVYSRHNNIANNTRKTINRWLFLAILALSCPLAAYAQNIVIDETNFPDNNFRQWLLEDETPIGGDNGGMGGVGIKGYLTQDEISSITTLVLNNLGITDLTGIGFFTNINMLRLAKDTDTNRNQIANVDLTNNTLLQRVYCKNIGLTNLTLPPASSSVLRQLFCQDNPGLTGTFDLSGYTALTQFECTGTNFEELILTGLSVLNNLKINNSLKKIDISGDVKLPASTDWSGTQLETVVAQGHVNITNFTFPATLKTLDIDGNGAVSTLNFTTKAPGLERIIASNSTTLYSLRYNKDNLKYLDISNCPNFATVDFSGNSKTDYGALDTLLIRNCINITRIDCQNNSLTYLDVSGCTKLDQVNCTFNLLTSLDFSTNTELTRLQISENLLTGDFNIDPATHPNIRVYIANRAGHSTHTNILTYNNIVNLQVNGGAYMRLDKTTGKYKEMNEHSDHTRDHISSLISGIDHLDEMPKLYNLLCRHNDLTVLDISTNTDLQYIELNNNRLLTLDLTRLIHLGEGPGADSHVDTQKSVEDLVVFDKNKVAIELPNGSDDINRFQNLVIDGGSITAVPALLTIGGKKYLQITTDVDQKDLDLYGLGHGSAIERHITYDYDTKSPFVKVNLSLMDVDITGNTYIMYISPNSKTDTPAAFYSGTLCLPYESIVPDDAEAYVIAGVEDVEKISIDAEDKAYTAFQPGGSTENQLTAVMYAGPGDVIPANTPVYIKATTPGLYAFKKNYDRDFYGWKVTAWNENTGTVNNDDIKPYYVEASQINPSVPSAPSVNLLTGALNNTLTPTAVPTHSVLTLGREKTHSHVGFWLFTSTTIPSHRAYIELSTPLWKQHVKKGGVLNLMNNLNNAFKQ